jgi:hypothetical protein
MNETESYFKSFNMSFVASNSTFSLPLDISAAVSLHDFPNVSNATNHVTLDNDTLVCDEQCVNGYKTTELRNNPWYIIFYVVAAKFLLVELIPWVAVIILTILTSRKIKQFQANRERLLKPSRIAGAPDEGKICFILLQHHFI